MTAAVGCRIVELLLTFRADSFERVGSEWALTDRDFVCYSNCDDCLGFLGGIYLVLFLHLSFSSCCRDSRHLRDVPAGQSFYVERLRAALVRAGSPVSVHSYYNDDHHLLPFVSDWKAQVVFVQGEILF